MNTKHTPAPWFVSKSPAQRSNKGKIHGRVFKSVKNTIGIGGKIIANAFGGNGIVTQQCIEEAEANAKLIALSPIMFEYLVKKADDGCEEAKNILSTLD